MSPKFSLKSGLITLVLSAAAAFAVLTPALDASAGDKQVTCDTIKKAGVKAHCNKVKGEYKAIRDAMKAAQKAYNDDPKKDGDDLKCVTCHEKGNGGALKQADSDKHWPKFEPFFTKAAGG